MFWAGDENCQWTTMDHADCLWESSRSLDQLQRRRVGRTWTCSVERRQDDVWQTVVDYERPTFATGMQKLDRYNGTEWRMQQNVMSRKTLCLQYSVSNGIIWNVANTTECNSKLAVLYRRYAYCFITLSVIKHSNKHISCIKLLL